MDSYFREPKQICTKLKHVFGDDHSDTIYGYLLNFGMYRPSRQTNACFKEIKSMDLWEKIDHMYTKYRKKWKGPDIPLYIFPIDSGGVFTKGFRKRKSGVSFKDKMFLFLSPLDDEKEIEALFVHEYHHVCRMNKLRKKLDEYTLLDSIILEGLAENAVLEICGEEYISDWCSYYTGKELSTIWDRYMKENLGSTKKSKLHDDLLFGLKGFPPMIGYAVGYDKVLEYKEKHGLSIKESFLIPANHLIETV